MVMAGSFENPVRKTSHTARTNNYVSSYVAISYAFVAFSAIPLWQGLTDWRRSQGAKPPRSFS